MAGAPSHADDWRCPLHCHSMTVPRLLKIDGGELGQKKHVNSDQKTQLGHVAAHGRTASKPSAWSHGEIVAVWKRDPICLRLDAMRFLLCRKERKSQPPLTQTHTDEFVYFDRFSPEKDNIFLGGNGKLRSRYWLFKVRWYVFLAGLYKSELQLHIPRC